MGLVLLLRAMLDGSLDGLVWLQLGLAWWGEVGPLFLGFLVSGFVTTPRC